MMKVNSTCLEDYKRKFMIFKGNFYMQDQVESDLI